MKRRDFFKVAAAAGVSYAASPVIRAADNSLIASANQEIETNIADASKSPRVAGSMPGRFPGRVVKCINGKSVSAEGEHNPEVIYDMLAKSMLALTGKDNLPDAWRMFVSPEDIIGLKVNPVAGRLLTTSHAVTKSVVRQLEEAGIPRNNIVIWDRREMQLHETGYTQENYPGITIIGTECMDQKGGFYDNEGKLYSQGRIDKEHFFYANLEGEYDDYTIPYMVNGGKYSYFTNIVTQKVTKIINLPILKNAGPTTTLCLKNLSFGSVTNTGRLHQLWHETCAYVCAFAPLRDKVVLNIADGITGCFEGGPSAKPQYICNYNMLLVGTDPVAVDRVGHDVVIAKRIGMGIQQEDKPSASRFLDLAQELNLGIGKRDQIEIEELLLG
jgi:hypothetical protein